MPYYYKTLYILFRKLLYICINKVPKKTNVGWMFSKICVIQSISLGAYIRNSMVHIYLYITRGYIFFF